MLFDESGTTGYTVDPERLRVAPLPEDEMQRARRLIQIARLTPQTPLTVGDLSSVTAAKREAEQESKTGLDSLFCIPEDERNLDELYQGPAAPTPCQSESQKLNNEIIRKFKNKQRIEQLLHSEQEG